MNLRQAILREYLGRYVTDPQKPCIALVAEKESDADLSRFHQLVYRPRDIDYMPLEVHMIATPEKVDEAKFHYCFEYNVLLSEVGETYCTYPYTMGFSHIGKTEKEMHRQRVDALNDPIIFMRYMQRFMQLDEGKALLIDYARNEKGISEEFIGKFLKDDKATTLKMKKIKNEYYTRHLYDHGQPGFSQYKEGMIERFKEAQKEMSGEERKEHLFDFYDNTTKEEKKHFRAVVSDYKRAPWLFPKMKRA